MSSWVCLEYDLLITRREEKRKVSLTLHDVMRGALCQASGQWEEQELLVQLAIILLTDSKSWFIHRVLFTTLKEVFVGVGRMKLVV